VTTTPCQPVRVGALVERIETWNPASCDNERIFTYIDIASVNSNLKEIVGSRTLKCSDAPSRARQLLRAGDVLVSTVRPNLNAVAHVPRQLDGATASTGFCVLRANRTRLSDRYLFHWVRTNDFVNAMVRQATGASYPAVSDRIICESVIPLPHPDNPKKSLAEQTRIATILDKADEICRKKHGTIKNLADLQQSLFLYYFGDPSTNSKGWPIGTIRELVAETQYGTSAKAGLAGRYPVLRMNNITAEGEWNFDDLKYMDLDSSVTQKYLVRAGDILFNRTNSPELVGKTAVYRSSKLMAFAGYLVRVRANERALPDYIAGYLNSSHGKAVLARTCKHIIGMANINAQEMQNIRIALPPMKLQTIYMEALACVRQKREKQVTFTVAAESMFAGLVQRAFQGEL